jgi:hypothetical protein
LEGRHVGELFCSLYRACFRVLTDQPKAEFKGCLIFKPAKQAPKNTTRIHKPA